MELSHHLLAILLIWSNPQSLASLVPQYRRTSGWPEALLLAVPLALPPLNLKGAYSLATGGLFCGFGAAASFSFVLRACRGSSLLGSFRA